MKLLKKLLPVASVAGVAAIVAPLATSCANGSISFNALDPLDLTGWKQSDKEQLNPDQAVTEYAARIKEDKSIFINDFKYGRNILANTLAPLVHQHYTKEGSNNISMSWLNSTITLKDVSCSENGPSEAISFKSTLNFGVDIKYTITSKDEDINKRVIEEIKMDINVLNAPFTFLPFNLLTTDTICLSLLFGKSYKQEEYLSLDKEWHVILSANTIETNCDYETGTPIQQTDFVQSWDINRDNIANIEAESESAAPWLFNELLSFSYSWPAYYFMNTKVK